MPEKVRLIVGFSGAGKTAWAAEGSVHSGRPVAYFDVGDMPTAAVAPSLARELAAVLMHDKRDEIRRIMLPGSSGLQSLRGIDRFVQNSGVPFTAVLDNVHRMDANELTNILRSPRRSTGSCWRNPGPTDPSRSKSQNNGHLAPRMVRRRNRWRVPN